MSPPRKQRPCCGAQQQQRCRERSPSCRAALPYWGTAATSRVIRTVPNRREPVRRFRSLRRPRWPQVARRGLSMTLRTTSRQQWGPGQVSSSQCRGLRCGRCWLAACVLGPASMASGPCSLACSSCLLTLPGRAVFVPAVRASSCPLTGVALAPAVPFVSPTGFAGQDAHADGPACVNLGGQGVAHAAQPSAPAAVQ